MKCQKCEKKAVISLQHGGLCKTHFLSYFEEKVFKTIKKWKLIKREDVICVATSGGKDSLAVLYLTRKYLEKNNLQNKIFALVIDEGIKDYREHTIKDLETFCEKYNIQLKQASYKEAFNATLDEAHPKINKDTGKKPCNICGVWRRYLLNKLAREQGATKLITGHNLDDEAQVILMNIFKANTKLAAHLGPISGISEHNQFVQRVKPLYFCTEKETRLFALLKGFDVQFTECPNAQEGYRAAIRDVLNDFEQKYKGTKQGIIRSFLSLLPILKEQAKNAEECIKQCEKCGEPANKTICNACSLIEVLNG
jgi:tRNA-5-methyluridine54 2-sulfurtransferase